MKSRLASASTIRGPAGRAALRAAAATLWGATAKAATSVLATATTPRKSGQGEPEAMLQPRAMQPNTATWTALSPQKSRAAPPEDSRNLSRAISPSQPSRIECRRKRRAPATCHSGTRGQEERRAGEADGERHTRHPVGRQRGPDETPRHRQRDAPLDVARHEALAVLDEAAKQPGLRGPQVAAV